MATPSSLVPIAFGEYTIGNRKGFQNSSSLNSFSPLRRSIVTRRGGLISVGDLRYMWYYDIVFEGPWRHGCRMSCILSMIASHLAPNSTDKSSETKRQGGPEIRGPEKKPDEPLFNARKYIRLMHPGYSVLIDENAKSNSVVDQEVSE